MPTERDGEPPPAERAKLIKNKIVQRTGGRIQKLEAEVIGNRVVIRGRVAATISSNSRSRQPLMRLVPQAQCVSNSMSKWWEVPEV
jgi:hypothetical protein